MAFEYSKQGYMKSWSYGGFTYNGGTYCEEHLPVDPDMQECDETGTAPHPIFADSEWDYYPACDVRGCEVVFDYVNLTDEGRRYEAEQRAGIYDWEAGGYG